MSTALFNLDSDGTLEILISRANIKKITRVMIAEPGRKTAKNFLLDTQPPESEWELNPGRCTCEHLPKNDKLITLDKKRDYKIKSCSLKAGVYRMELERVRG